MQKYPRQFIDSVIMNLNPLLSDFHMKNHTYYHFPYSSFFDVVEDALMSEFKGTSSSDEIYSIVQKMRESRKKKKSRWYKNTCKELDVEYPSEVFEVNLVEKDAKQKALDTWKSNGASLLIEFPFLNNFTNTSIYNSFKSDIIMSAWEYINKELGGNIASFYKSYPVSFLNSPLFSPNAFNLELKDYSERFWNDVLRDENDNPLLEIYVPKDSVLQPPKSMDVIDMAIMSVLMQNITNDFYTNNIVIVDIRTLAKSIGSIGGKSFDYIGNRCRKLVDYSFHVDSGKTGLSFNLFDSIKISESADGKSFVIAKFGSILSQAIIQKKLVMVTSDNYKLLNNSISKIIYYALQQERLMLHNSGSKDMISSMSYTYLQSIILFRSRKAKKKNMAAVAESLQEFVDNNICIKNYQVKTNEIIIEYYPLTDSEVEDTTLNNNVLIDIQQSELPLE